MLDKTVKHFISLKIMGKMNEFPSSYEQFLKVHKKTVSDVSESEFYKEGLFVHCCAVGVLNASKSYHLNWNVISKSYTKNILKEFNILKNNFENILSEATYIGVHKPKFDGRK